MKQFQKMFVVMGSLLVLIGTTLPILPQATRRKSSPIQAETPAPPAKVPTERVSAPPPAPSTKLPTERVSAPPPITTRRAITERMIAPPPEPESKTYEKPRYMDDRLDWCLNFGYNCGEAAARAFCNRRRFEDVKAFEAELLGRSAQTRLMGTDEVCNADFCTGFAYITCSNPIDMNRIFANPEWKGYRLDSCLVEGGYCGGRQAADRFCISRGFSESLASTIDREPSNVPTMTIGNGAICERGCKGFQQIICTKIER